MYCIASHRIVSYYIVLRCIVLYCFTLYCIVLRCIVLFYVVLFYVVLYCIVLYCIVLRCIVLYCIVSYRIVSHRVARIASHRIASHRIASHRIVSYRIVLYSTSHGSLCSRVLPWSMLWSTNPSSMSNAFLFSRFLLSPDPCYPCPFLLPIRCVLISPAPSTPVWSTPVELFLRHHPRQFIPLVYPSPATRHPVSFSFSCQPCPANVVVLNYNSLLCTQLRGFIWLYLTVIVLNKDSFIHSTCPSRQRHSFRCICWIDTVKFLHDHE